MDIRRQHVDLPDFGLPAAEPTLNQALYEARLQRLRDRMADAMRRAKASEQPVPLDGVRWVSESVAMPLRTGKGFSEEEIVAAIGLGVAMHADRPVVVFDGDGAALMKMGNLATIGAVSPKRFVHVVFDNECHASTGGQRTVSANVDFATIAVACGYAVESLGKVPGELALIVWNVLPTSRLHDVAVGHLPAAVIEQPDLPAGGGAEATNDVPHLVFGEVAVLRHRTGQAAPQVRLVGRRVAIEFRRRRAHRSVSSRQVFSPTTNCGLRFRRR